MDAPPPSPPGSRLADAPHAAAARLLVPIRDAGQPVDAAADLAWPTSAGYGGRHDKPPGIVDDGVDAPGARDRDPDLDPAAPAATTRFLIASDARTNKTLSLPIHCDVVDASAFEEFGLSIYDNGYLNTAVCRSRICHVDGERGILCYRGYRIEDLVARCSFLEVAYLLIYGELPSVRQLSAWTTRVNHHTYVHENLVEYLRCFRYDAHPMGMLVSAAAAMSTFHQEASPAFRGDAVYASDAVVNKQIFRLLGKIPTLAAIAYRHRIGRPYVYPRSELSYVGNFLYMMDRLSEN
ncbi:hypothetical protein HK405_005706, partial [Cladochytrium tenue]